MYMGSTICVDLDFIIAIDVSAEISHLYSTVQYSTVHGQVPG